MQARRSFGVVKAYNPHEADDGPGMKTEKAAKTAAILYMYSSASNAVTNAHAQTLPGVTIVSRNENPQSPNTISCT